MFVLCVLLFVPLLSGSHAVWPLNLVPTVGSSDKLRRGDCRRLTSRPHCTVRCEFFERQAGSPLYEQEPLPVIVDDFGTFMSLPAPKNPVDHWTFVLTQPPNASFRLEVGLNNGQLKVDEEVDYDIGPPAPSVAELTATLNSSASSPTISVSCHLEVSVKDFDESPMINVTVGPSTERFYDPFTLETINSAEVFFVSEHTPIGSVVLQLAVTDPDDRPDTVTCHTNVTQHLNELRASFGMLVTRRLTYQYHLHWQFRGNEFRQELDAAALVFGLRRSNSSKSLWQVFTRSPLDFEQLNSPARFRLQNYELPVFCRGGENGSDFSETFLPIKLGDINEFTPNCFTSGKVHTENETNAYTNIPLEVFQCSDIESPVAFNVSLELAGEGAEDMNLVIVDLPHLLRFYPPRIVAVLYFRGRLDYERRSRYDIQILAIDTAHGKRLVDVAARITLIVLDVDEPPSFNESEYNISLVENTPVGSRFFRFSARDPDRADANRTITFASEVVKVDGLSVPPDAVEQTWFYINSTTGDLYTNHSFDRESLPRVISLNVTSTEHNVSGPSFSTVQANIAIAGANEFPPHFSQRQYPFHIDENGAMAELVGTVRAVDPDKGTNRAPEYFLASTDDLSDDGRFFEMDSLNQSSGQLYSRVSFDREKKERYKFLVYARDSDVPSLTSSALITVYIDDVNDNAPQFLSPPPLVTVPQNVTVGTVLSRFSISDADVNIVLSVSFSLIPVKKHDEYVLPKHFKIDQDGSLSVIRPLHEIQARDYRVFVIVSDNDNTKRLSSTATVTLKIIGRPQPMQPAAGSGNSNLSNIKILIVAIGCSALLIFILIVLVVKVRLVQKRRRAQEKVQRGKLVINPVASSLDSPLKSPGARPSTLPLSSHVGSPSSISTAFSNDYITSLENRASTLGTPLDTPHSIGDVVGLFSSAPVSSVRKRAAFYNQDAPNLTPSSGKGENSSKLQVQRRISTRTCESTVDLSLESEDSGTFLDQAGSSIPTSQGALSTEPSPQRNSMMSRSHAYATPPQTTASTPQSAAPNVFGSPRSHTQSKHMSPRFANTDPTNMASMTPLHRCQPVTNHLFRQSSQSSSLYGSPGRRSIESGLHTNYLDHETIL